MDKISITYNELWNNIVPALHNLSRMPLQGKLGYAVGKNLISLDKEMARLDEARRVLAMEHAKIDADGSLELDEGGKPQFSSEEAEKNFKQALEALLEEKREVRVHRFDGRLFEGVSNFPPAIMLALSPLMFEDDADTAEQSAGGILEPGLRVVDSQGKPAPTPAGGLE